MVVPFTQSQAFLISVALGIIGAIISYFCVQRITVHQQEAKSRPQHGSDVVHSLNKAKKHLMRVRASSVGELHTDIAQILEEMKNLSPSFSKNIEQTVSHSEYAAVEKIFSYLQVISASLMAFAHDGANDVANAIGTLTTGVIAMQIAIPPWILALGGGIIIGLATWGWRVIETIGKKSPNCPTRGFVAEFGAATTILVASRMGMPISTTHTLVGAVLGVGLARGISASSLDFSWWASLFAFQEKTPVAYSFQFYSQRLGNAGISGCSDH